MKTATWNTYVLLAVCLAVPLIVGAVGGVATARSLPDWYAGLNKPSWNPPNWVFGPVWTILYILMGIALWRILRLGWSAPGVSLAVWAFGLQLALNLAWSLVFFGLRAPGLALIEIIILLAVLVFTLWRFLGLDAVAGWLLVPYVLWSTFATVLNATVWRLNLP